MLGKLLGFSVFLALDTLISISFYLRDTGGRLRGYIFTIDVKPEKNSIFLKKGKTVISIENRKFSRSRMTKRTEPLNSSREI